MWDRLDRFWKTWKTNVRTVYRVSKCTVAKKLLPADLWSVWDVVRCWRLPLLTKKERPSNKLSQKRHNRRLVQYSKRTRCLTLSTIRTCPHTAVYSCPKTKRRSNALWILCSLSWPRLEMTRPCVSGIWTRNKLLSASTLEHRQLAYSLVRMDLTW